MLKQLQHHQMDGNLNIFGPLSPIPPSLAAGLSSTRVAVAGTPATAAAPTTAAVCVS